MWDFLSGAKICDAILPPSKFLVQGIFSFDILLILWLQYLYETLFGKGGLWRFDLEPLPL